MDEEETVLQEAAACLANAKAINPNIAVAAVLQWNEEEGKEVKPLFLCAWKMDVFTSV